MTEEERIAELEAELGELKFELAGLKVRLDTAEFERDACMQERDSYKAALDEKTAFEKASPYIRRFPTETVLDRMDKFDLDRVLYPNEAELDRMLEESEISAISAAEIAYDIGERT